MLPWIANELDEKISSDCMFYQGYRKNKHKIPSGLTNKYVRYVVKDLPVDEKSTSIKIMRKRA